MICQNCKSETSGIKINGKLFCGICGEKLDYNLKALSKSSEPLDDLNPKIIQPANEIEQRIDELGAELEALTELENVAAEQENAVEEKNDLNALQAAEELIDKIDYSKNNSNSTGPDKTDTGKISQVIKKNRPHLKHINNKDAIDTVVNTAAQTTVQTENAKSADAQVSNINILETEKNTNLTQEVSLPMNNLTAPTAAIEEKSISVSEDSSEKGYCVKCKTQRGMIKTEETVLKNGHHALKGICEVCGTKVFKFLKGTPEKKENVKQLSTEPESPKHQNSFLTGYFRQGAVQASKTNTEKVTKKKTKHKFSIKVFLAIFIPLLILVSFIALVFYVNFFAINGERSKETAERKANFAYQKPDYIPTGYTISPKTNAESNFIEYVYHLIILEQSGKEKVSDELTIKIKKITLNETSIKNEILKNTQTYQEEVLASDIKIWILNDKILYFYDNGVLYEISSSGKISKEELKKIATTITE